MSIDQSSRVGPTRTPRVQQTEGVTPSTRTRKTASTSPGQAQEPDEVILSEKAILSGRLQQAAQETPEIRQEVVGPIKKAVENGTYNLDAESIARAMLHLDE